MSEKVTQGQEFEVKAAVWNGFVDAADAHKANQVNLGSETGRTINPVGLVLVKNASGVKLDQFALVALTDIVINPTTAAAKRTFRNDIPFFKADAYDDDTKDRPVAILQEPIAKDKTGKALVLGVTPGLVNISNASHNSAVGDRENKFKLKSAPDGDIKILWKPSGTGEQLCMLAVGLGGLLSYRSIFKLVQENNTIKIVNGADEDDENAGFVFCNGKLKEVPAGSVSASSGYICLKATLHNKEFSVDYAVTSSIEGDANTGYYVLGYVRSATGGGGVEVLQYYHASPHISIIGDCKEDEDQ